MTAIETIETLPLTAYEVAVAQMYDGKRNDMNLLFGKESGLVHHHFGIGSVDADDYGAIAPAETTRILHDLETRQVHYLLRAMVGINADSRVFDGGSGRAGTAILLHQAFGCHYDGVTISRYQLDFSRALARERRIDERVHFHLMNMRQTTFDDAAFDYVLTNETTMYAVDLHELFAEFRRLLRERGRYVFATWSIDETNPDALPIIASIDEHYACHMHRSGDYFRALLDNDLVPYHVEDLSEEALPYWELRDASSHRTGIERHFIEGYRCHAIRYLVVGAQYFPRR